MSDTRLPTCFISQGGVYNRLEAALAAWERAPAARLAHPREEHRLPLRMALGAAEGEAATRVYHERDLFGGISVSSYRFG
jgi:aromatic ring-opening dioxygenase catalytic subunit (LigB family)